MENLPTSNKDLVDQIVKENNPDKLEQLMAKFKTAQLKRNIIRADKLSDIAAVLDEEMLQRIQTEPEMISNRDLTAYMQIINSTITAVNNSINNIPEVAVQVNNNIEINNDTGLTASQRQNVLEAVSKILADKREQEDIIDVTYEDKDE